MKSLPAKIIVVLVTLLIASQAQAFEGHRKGFMMVLGAGIGNGEVKFSFEDESISDKSSGLASNLKIGAGLSNKSLLYYTNSVIWWSADGVDYITGMSAIGYSYFFSPQAPSFFLSGSIGLGFASIQNFDTDTGGGLGLGVGYEFAKNWTLEAQFLTADLGEFSGITMTTSNASLTISWFTY